MRKPRILFEQAMIEKMQDLQEKVKRKNLEKEKRKNK